MTRARVRGRRRKEESGSRGKSKLLTIFLVGNHFVVGVGLGTVGAIDLNYLVTVGLPIDRIVLGGLFNGLVDTDDLLEGGTVDFRGFDGGLGHADAIAVAGVGSSTVFTLDMVDGVVRNRRKRLRVWVVVVVVSVGIDLKTSV